MLVKEPRCIRYFKRKDLAEIACSFLKKEGFECYVDEDRFYDITLPELGMVPRFKLMVERIEIFKIANVLEKKIKK